LIECHLKSDSFMQYLIEEQRRKIVGLLWRKEKEFDSGSAVPARNGTWVLLGRYHQRDYTGKMFNHVV